MSLFQTAEQLRWRNEDRLMSGGDVLSKAAERLQAFDKWLDQNPLIRKVISNLGGIAGGAFWIKMAVAQGGAQVIATVLAVDYA